MRRRRASEARVGCGGAAHRRREPSTWYNDPKGDLDPGRPYAAPLSLALRPLPRVNGPSSERTGRLRI
jgi:hypothetical protein